MTSPAAAPRERMCDFRGQRRGQFMGTTTNDLIRCQARGTDLWLDPETGDYYCPRHEKMIKRRRAR